jgi:formate hydrogenlyase transcriptional activator
MEIAPRTDQATESHLDHDRLQLLLKVNNAVVTQLSLHDLARATATALRGTFQHEVTGISFYEPEAHQFRAFMFDVSGNIPVVAEGTPLPVEGTAGGMALLSGQPFFQNRFDPALLTSDFDRGFYAAGIRSGGCVPLIAHGRKLGVLGVASFREDAFLEKDQELLVHIANQIALAVENALNFQRAQVAEQQATQHSARTKLLLEVNNAIASALDLPSLFHAVSACLRQVFQHDYAVMGLYDDQAEILRVHLLDRGTGITLLQEGEVAQLDNTPVGLAIRSKQVVVTGTDYLNEFPSDVVRRAVEQGIRANCSAPLLRQNRVIGAMSIASKTECAFTKEDGELFMQIAAQVAIAVENALAYREIEALKNQLNEEKLYLEDEIRTLHNFEEIIGESAALKRILKQVETAAPTDSTILIRGETGTGKELIARAIHNLSNRRERTLVKLNCAAIPTGLLESELFGHEKGTFTGAIAQRIGRFELANKGTLFLDEVGDIPLELQPKLLRVLQEQEFERLGSTRTQKVDVRMVAATNCDLVQMVADKQYRSDLYYRLNVFPITIPPLRERREDVPLLVRFFAQKFAQRMKKRIERIPTEVMTTLTQYPWPGNVRELENVIERAVILSSGSELEIPVAELKPAAAATVSTVPTNHLTMEAAEREHILRVLRETDWVVGGPTGAAARLGLNRSTLQSRMRKLGIERPK